MPADNSTKYFNSVGDSGASGQLKFRTIAQTLDQNETNIRFGDYKRKPGLDEVFADVGATPALKALATAIVPDAVQNSNISTGNNLKVSQLRSMVKKVVVAHTGGSNSQSNIHNITEGNLNDNLGKNVPKVVEIQNVWKAGSTSEYAMAVEGDLYNLHLQLDDSAKLYGREGVAGDGQTYAESTSTPAVSSNGGDGGSALYIKNNVTRGSGSTNVNVYLGTSAKILGGGGGGAGGDAGTWVNSTANCTSRVTNGPFNKGIISRSSCEHNCSSPNNATDCRCNANRSYRRQRGYRRGTRYCTSYSYYCTGPVSGDFAVSGNPKAGGNGGVGQGANNIGGPGNGNEGTSASYGCSSGTTNANARAAKSGTGKNGGGFGQDGGSNQNNFGGKSGKYLINSQNTRVTFNGATSTTAGSGNLLGGTGTI